MTRLAYHEGRCQRPTRLGGRSAQKTRTRDALIAAARDLVAAGVTPTIEDAAAAAVHLAHDGLSLLPEQACTAVRRAPRDRRDVDASSQPAAGSGGPTRRRRRQLHRHDPRHRGAAAHDAAPLARGRRCRTRRSFPFDRDVRSLGSPRRSTAVAATSPTNSSANSCSASAPPSESKRSCGSSTSPASRGTTPSRSCDGPRRPSFNRPPPSAPDAEGVAVEARRAATSVGLLATPGPVVVWPRLTRSGDTSPSPSRRCWLRPARWAPCTDVPKRSGCAEPRPR